MALYHKIRLILGCMICVFALVACGSSDKPALEFPPLTLPAPATPIFAGFCDDIATLETYLQITQFQQRDFMTLMSGSLGENGDRNVIYQNVEQMALYRNRISEAPAPDCAESLHLDVLEIMETVLNDMQAYVNGDDVDLEGLVENARAEFNGLLPEQGELLNRLEN